MKLNDLLGLTKLKRKASIDIQASLRSGEPFPHTLLYGIGGTGKTAFARAIGAELGYHFVEVEGIVFKHREILVEHLRRSSIDAQRSGKILLLFIDEVHRLSLPVQEALYVPMKEWRITSEAGDITFPRFSLIAATTRFDKLDTNSFVKRFDNLWELGRYPWDEMELIVAAELKKNGLGFSYLVVKEIAKRCLGVPRVAVSLVKRVYRSSIAAGHQEVSLADVKGTFMREELDGRGLSPSHRRYVEILFKNGPNPMGLGVIASKMSTNDDMVSGSIEPILLELDFVSQGSRGRVLTEEGHTYFRNFSKKALDIRNGCGKVGA